VQGTKADFDMELTFILWNKHLDILWNVLVKIKLSRVEGLADGPLIQH
jgi:hypothetical protein